MARLVQVMIFIFVSLTLTACGGGGAGEEGGVSASANNTTTAASSDTTSGSSSSESGSSSSSESGSTGSTGSGTSPTPVANATATVTWTIPSTRQSGASLAMSEIGGYKVYYGVSSTNLNLSVNVADPYKTSQQISNLVSGTVYYFRVTAYDTTNAESSPSNLVNRTAS